MKQDTPTQSAFAFIEPVRALRVQELPVDDWLYEFDGYRALAFKAGKEVRLLSRRAFVTSDGVQLSYIRQGSGRPVILIRTWSQCAEEFKHQIEPLSPQYDVIAVDQRSRGESQKVSYGLKIRG